MAKIEIIARGLWLRDDSVLLCRSTKRGYLYLPGGHVEHGESASAALRREMIEETGVSVTVGSPLLCVELSFHDHKPRHEYSVVFHVEPTEPIDDVVSLEDGISFEWVPLAVVPDLDIRPEPIRAWLSAGGQSGDAPQVAWISGIAEH